MFGINPAMIGFVFKGQLDEILSGKEPEFVKIKERTAERIVLVPAEPEMFEGIEIKKIDISIVYKNVEFVLTND